MATRDDWMHSAIQIQRAEDDDKFACCSVCTGRQTEECDDCNEADLFEIDEEAVEEQMEPA